MKIYATIKIAYPNETPRVEKYTLTHKWGENTVLGGFFRDDFDWTQSKTNTICWFGRNICDRYITAFVVVYK